MSQKMRFKKSCGFAWFSFFASFLENILFNQTVEKKILIYKTFYLTSAKKGWSLKLGFDRNLQPFLDTASENNTKNKGL